MDTFFEYWKKGWKVWLMMVCVNLSYLLLLIPISFFDIFLRGSTKGLDYFIIITLGLIFVPALTYWVFKFFYGEK